MEKTEELLSEVYGVLMVLGIVMNEEEALESLKKAQFDDPTANLILETAKEVQQLTQEHQEKLSEIIQQDQLKDDETDELVKAYLTSQGVEPEITEVVYLYHSFLISINIAETVILEGEKRGLDTKAILKEIKELSDLDRGRSRVHIHHCHDPYGQEL